MWRASEKGGPYVNISGARSGNEYVDKQVSGAEGFFYKIRPSLSGAALSEYAFGVPDPFPTQMGISDGYNTDGSCSYNVAVSGNYAYVADGDKGLRIFNITDPNDIALVKTVASTLAMDVAVNDDYIFLADQAGGLRVYDIDTAQLRHTVVLGGLSNAFGVTVSGNYVYVACSGGGAGSLKIIDISDPDPLNFDIVDDESLADSAFDVDVVGDYAYIAAYTAGLVIMDISVINNTSPADSFTVDTTQSAFDVAVSGNYAYVAASANLSNPTGGLKVINISTPATASVDHSIDTPGIAHGVTVFGSSVYVADEQVGLQIIQAEDPETAFLYDTIAMPPFYDVRGVTVIEGYAYMAGSNGSFYVLNVKNPFSNPQIINTLATSDNANKIAVSGEYLFLAADDGGLRIYSIADAGSPVLFKSISEPGGYADLEVKGDYLFASVGTGIVVIDIENPASAALIGGLTTNGLSKGLEVHGDFAYVACSNAGLKIIDISNPSSPILVDTIYTAGSAYGVDIDEGYAFVTDYASGVQIVDISDPYSADIIENVSITGNAQGITVSHDYAYITAYDSTTQYGLQILDISNIATTAVVGEVATPYSAAWSCLVCGNYAYVANHTGGVIIVDVSDPENPIAVKQIDASDEFSSRTIGTAVSGKYLYSADGGDGLRVIDLLP